jgi:hypothetical protein
MTKVVGFVILSALLAGCGTFVRSSTGEAAYDYSDWASYDKPFATSPDYSVAAMVPAGVADVQQPSQVNEAPAVVTGSATASR